MSQVSKEYRRISKGFKNFKLVEVDEFKDNLEAALKSDPNSDYYSSLYTYGEDDYKLWKETGKVAGITDIKTNRIVFDLDKAGDLELTRKDAITLCERLIQSGIEQNKIKIYFSGSKGFHIELDTTDSFSRTEYENILKNLAGDLSTLDTKVTDEQRIFRIALTKHPKTGLYKIPLTLKELQNSTIEHIKKDAKVVKRKHKTLVDIDTKIALPESITKFKTVEKVVETKSQSLNLDYSDTLDLSLKPKWISAVRYALMQGYFKSGEGVRNKAFMILAATFKANGFPREIAYRMLKGVSEIQAKRNNSEPYDKHELWNNIISQVYSPLWQGGIYSDKNDEFLVATAKALNIQDEEKENINLDISSMINKFIDRSKNARTRTIKTGIDEIDSKIIIQPGMMVSILGATGSGKTNIINNIVEYNSLHNQHILYNSIDLYEDALVSRLLSKYTNLSYMQLLNQISEDKIDDNIKNGFEQVKKHFQNVTFDFRTGITVEDIEQNIVDIEKNTGKKIKLLVVDYLERIRSPYTDPTAAGAFVASRLADIAKRHDLVLFLIVQPNKISGDVKEPLLSYINIKGSGTISQDSRLILTLWRPGYNPEDSSMDKYMSVACIKNNMGPTFKIDLAWEPVTGKLKSMTALERIQLREFLQNKEEESNQKVINDPFKFVKREK